ncbi:MAG: hypothetical protein IJT94_18090, partial [Oscillibacter sp.]|nr:hypothetical protein [Oscillibacter sp.]
MCKTVYKKIHSSVGASLAIALLLFLACTVVGTVVLTAASAVSGRAAELTFMDQRYHSVASAAALLEKELCGKDVTIERSKTVAEWDITRHTLNDEGEVTSTTNHSDFEVNYSTIINGYINNSNPWPVDKFFSRETRSEPQKANLEDGISLDLTSKSFLTTMAVNLLFGDSSDGSPGSALKCNTDDALTKYSFANTSGNLQDFYCDGTFILQHDPNTIGGNPGNSMSEYDALCTYKLKKD